jgi:nucleoid DNA-binding protein
MFLHVQEDHEVAPKVNPRTGEPLKIQAKKKIRFKAGSELSDSVN